MKTLTAQAVVAACIATHNESLKLTGTKRLSRAVIERRASIFTGYYRSLDGCPHRKHLKLLQRMLLDLDTCSCYFLDVFGRGLALITSTELARLEHNFKLPQINRQEEVARQHDAAIVYKRKCAGLSINDPELEVYIERLAVIADTFEQFPEIVGSALIRWARIELSEMLDLRKRRMSNRRYLSMSDPENAKGVRTDAVP